MARSEVGGGGGKRAVIPKGKPKLPTSLAQAESRGPYADFSSIPGSFAPPAAAVTTTTTGGGAVTGDVKGGPPHTDPVAPGRGKDTPPDTKLPIDWKSYITEFAIDDKELSEEIDRIFRETTDITRAVKIAISTARGSQWYANTYPGIVEAKAKGMVGDERDYRAQLNGVSQLYQQYFGRDVTLGDFSNYLKAGKNVSQISKELQAGAITTTLKNTSKDLLNYFSGEDLAKIGLHQAGLQNADTMYLSGLYDYASKVQPLYSQYDTTLDKNQLAQMYQQGLSPDTIARRLQGSAYIKANQGQLQYQAGAFGEGRLGENDLQAFGQQTAGIDTVLGNRIQLQIQQAQRRMQQVFQGVLASPNFTTQGGRLRSQTTSPDIGA